ncbi:hypothetical protein LP421_02000 (plasmid) [Rhizobium sp. RCAM05350]|nr:hypothetical protein LP421_02000 [Rhizobium sp. RCAM05350]
MKGVLAKPELMAFGSTTSIANHCGVSVSTVMRFVAHIGFHEIAQARTIFRNELRHRLSVLLLGSGNEKRERWVDGPRHYLVRSSPGSVVYAGSEDWSDEGHWRLH